MQTYRNPVFPYVRSSDEDAVRRVRHPVIVVGAGPAGLAAAIDLAQHGVPVVVLDEDETVSHGSRAVCYAKRSLEILDRLGCGGAVVRKGVGWSVGKVFFRDGPVFSFNLLSDSGHRRPAFVNLQQYHLEEILLERARATGRVDLRWKNRVVAITAEEKQIGVTIDTPGGQYVLACDWLLACDGALSPVRGMLGQESKGQAFSNQFLSADVLMKADYPAERWFWFDAPFHPEQSTLLHRQADNVWRIDFQLARDADPEEERRPENVVPRLRAMLGERDFELEWVNIYRYSCRRMDSFRHGRVLFVGDAAHQMSPFGARGANSCIQDADNLAWKLRLVMDNKAPPTLLDTYSSERIAAAEENILHSARSTQFIAPETRVSRAFRDAVLSLARTCPFARRLVNSGRLSMPAILDRSPLNTPDSDAFLSGLVPGTPASDGPVAVNGELRWLLEFIGDSFNGLYFAHGLNELPAEVASGIAALTLNRIPVDTRVVVEPGNPIELPPGVVRLEDYEDFLVQRFDAVPGTFYLMRPDQHVCARWRRFDPARIRRAVLRATCNEVGEGQ
ncbi:MAG: FAD-dependent oxidoreductase [Rhodocyclaceae bacterium]